MTDMQNINKIILHLIRSAKPFNEITGFSNQPGIYAFFFFGDKFPIENYIPKKGEIIYIGKTESSQLTRDVKTHFADNKTGSSTVRRSLCVYLKDSLGLEPEPRNKVDFMKNRFTQFTFNFSSENILSSWFKQNLGMSFYEFAGSPSELDNLETKLIRATTPILNIDYKNPENPYKSKITEKRRETSLKSSSKAGYDVSEVSKPLPQKDNTARKLNKPDIEGEALYVDLWGKHLASIIESIKSKIQTERQLHQSSFEKAGRRKLYTFNLEIENGNIVNDIAGSAVARNLAFVLFESNKENDFLNDRKVKINMGKDFKLKITVSE